MSCQVYMASNTSLSQGSRARELATSVVVGVGGLLGLGMFWVDHRAWAT